MKPKPLALGIVANDFEEITVNEVTSVYVGSLLLVKEIIFHEQSAARVKSH